MEQLIWRPWREVARELAVERDPYKILELCDELTTAAAAQQSVPEERQDRVLQFVNSRDDPRHQKLTT